MHGTGGKDENGNPTTSYYDGVEKYQAAPLDKILEDYRSDVSLSEGQKFYLEGGKNYYVRSSVVLSKGFELMTNPEDVAKEKRATVYLSGLSGNRGLDGSVPTMNF